MKIIADKKIPKTIKDFTTWQVSRRAFIKSSLAVSAWSQMSFLQSCINDTSNTSILDTTQLKIVITVQNILFPKDKNGPGAIDFNADKYLLWVLADKRVDPDENDYIINGLKWINETAKEEKSDTFLNLSKKEQVALIQNIATKDWGESWLSVMLTFIFEAMISDPIYGFNKEGVGWKWLRHQVGFPQPTKDLRYDEIFKTVQKQQ